MNATKHRHSLATAAALLVAATAAVALTADKTPTGYMWDFGKLNVSYSSVPVFAWATGLGTPVRGLPISTGFAKNSGTVSFNFAGKPHYLYLAIR